MKKVASERAAVLRKLEEKIGYRFSKMELLETALSHDSYANEHRGEGAEGNERLEFLGDAVLELVVSAELYRLHPEADEGGLTQMRSFLVSGIELARLALELELGGYLNLGQGEETTGGREKESILSSAVEAIFGAVYLDGGMGAAGVVVRRLVLPALEQISQGDVPLDYKSHLQEVTQERFKALPVYEIVSEDGPDHAKQFQARVSLPESDLTAVGEGKTKRAAEQDAARELFRKIRAADGG